MGKSPLKRLGIGVSGANHHSHHHDTTSLPSLMTSSSKKNDDALFSTTRSLSATFRIYLQRWLLQCRVRPPPSKPRLLLLLSTTVLTLWITRLYRNTFWHRPYISHRNRALDNVPHPPRMIQLGPMTLGRRQRGTGEWVSLTGAGDATMTTVRLGPLPRKGSRELTERYNPLPHDAPKLKGSSAIDKGKCRAMHEWQRSHNPTCNLIHESSFGFEHPLGWNSDNVTAQFDYNQAKEEGKLFMDRNEQVRLVAGGAYRWVWMIREYDGTKRVIKTLRIDSKSKNFDLRNFDRHRRDAVAMDQLTASPLIVDMYGYCSNSGLFDWAEGGDLSNIFENNMTIPSKDHLLMIAYNISMSIHDAHNFDDRGRATIAHTDIKTDQFLFKDGYYRLSDFNRARFLPFNEETNSSCGFKVAKNGGNWRAPEEYAYGLETEKVDVYSLGNVLYFLLTKLDPWEDYNDSNSLYKKVMRGERPKIPKELLESDSSFDRFMIQAINLAWTHKAFERPGALEIAQRLKQGIQEYEATTREGVEVAAAAAGG